MGSVRATAAFGVLIIGDMEWGVNQGVNEIAAAINRAIEAAEEAARAEGWRAGMEEAAAFVDTHHVCRTGEVVESTRTMTSAMRVLLGAAIRARISEREKGGTAHHDRPPMPERPRNRTLHADGTITKGDDRGK